MKKIIILISCLLFVFVSFFVFSLKKNNKLLISKNDYNLAFTIDGVESKTMPTKGSGYVANNITCSDETIITFDNDNYIIEVEKINSESICKIDFTKELGNNSVTINISNSSKIDSTSKTTTENGRVMFYLTEEPSSITGGNYSLDGKTITINNITSKVSLNVTLGASIYDKLLSDKTTRLTRTSFSSSLETDNTKTLYTSTEDGTTVYYFAGNALDNWVKTNVPGVCTYDGYVVYKGDSNVVQDIMQNGDYYAPPVTTNSDCTSGKVCEVNYNTNIYMTGLTDTECESLFEYSGGGIMSSKATWNGDRDIYWRIIRTNKDKSIRLLYHGTSTTATDAYIGASAFNTNSNDPMYVGYKYGTSGSLVRNRYNTNNSAIKNIVDKWYMTNLFNFTDYLSKAAVYCNDREIASGTFGNSNNFEYAARNRLYTNKTPTYNCTNVKDAFSANNSSAKLDYPIGLMTADEVAFAGGVLNITSGNTYFTRNSNKTYSVGEANSWWLMSPNMHSGVPMMFGISWNNGPILSDGFTSSDTYSLYVRPVISLAGDIAWKSGDGTAENPYQVNIIKN